MRNDANHFSLCLEGFEGRNHCFECVAVERTETFVDKEGADAYIIACQIRQPQCQRETNQKFFTTTQGVNKARFAGLIMVC